jgi:hypothetical protein
VLDAAEAFGGRLPELFCGFDRREQPGPVPFPTSCSPQAWASATPVQLMRTLLRFDPWVPHGQAWLAPAFPPGFPDFGLHNVPLAGVRLSLEVVDGRFSAVEGMPPGLVVHHEPRPAIGVMHD